jgi:hypothetical protein
LEENRINWVLLNISTTLAFKPLIGTDENIEMTTPKNIVRACLGFKTNNSY